MPQSLTPGVDAPAPRYSIGFGVTFKAGLSALDSLIDGVFACDILASFNTAFVDMDTGALVVHRPTIYRSYLK